MEKTECVCVLFNEDFLSMGMDQWRFSFNVCVFNGKNCMESFFNVCVLVEMVLNVCVLQFLVEMVLMIGRGMNVDG